MNPFVGLDEEDYNVWSINWDLLVNFSPRTSRRRPGIAESWEVSEDRKTVTFKLVAGARSGPTASRSPPRTSSSRSRPSARRATCSPATRATSPRSRRPTTETVVIKTKRPDARIVGGLFVYILPEHVWGEVPLDELTGSYKPELPLVGSGPYIVTEFERGRIIRMERNPEFRGEPPAFDEIQFIKYGTQDAVERALQLGEIDMIVEVELERTSSGSRRSRTSRRSRAPRPSYTRARLQPLPGADLSRREVQPGDAGRRRCARRSPTRSTASGSTRSRPAAPRSPATGSCPPSTSRSTRSRSRTTRYDPELANQILDDAGWTLNGDGVAEQGRDRALASTSTCARSRRTTSRRRKLIAEQASRDRGRVQRPGGQRRQAHRADRSARSTASRRPTSTPSSGAGAATPTTRASCSACFLTERDRRALRLLLLEPRVRPALTGAGRASSTSRSARR